MVKDCKTCQEFHRTQTSESLISSELPTRPWQILGTDLFHYEGNNYLVLADYYSKFPFVRKMPTLCTSQAVVEATKQLLGEHGIPERIRSDNGRHFDSACYRQFAESWGFDHVTSSPHFPQSNGFVERAIGTIKLALKKAKSSGQDGEMALLVLRTTPIDCKLPTPAELLYTRRIMSNLPVRIPNVLHDRDRLYNRLSERQESQKQYHDQSSRDLPAVAPGREVRIQDHNTGRWSPAKIVSTGPEPRSYIVQTPTGSTLRRNRRHILDVPQSTKKSVSFSPETTAVESPTPVVQPLEVPNTGPPPYQR